jgi:D-alanine-D-alanine ligase
MYTGDEALPPDLSLPAIIKPVAEGSSKGVLPASVVTSEVALRDLARTMATRYGQGALVEEYLPGREFTVAVLGEPAVALPPMEVVFREGLELPVYSFDHKLEPNSEVRYEAPARISDGLDIELRSLARRAFSVLGCRDVGRVDLRLDCHGRPSFIECNPLPGLSPGWSDLCLVAEAAGIDYHKLIARILEPALGRARAAADRKIAPGAAASV